MITSRISIGEIIGQSWKVLLSRIWFLLAISIVTCAVPKIPDLISVFVGSSRDWSILILILQGYIAIGVINVILKVARQQKATLADLLFIRPQTLFSCFIASVCSIFIALIGLLPLIIPGFYLAIKWSQVLYFVVDKRAGPLEAMGMSWKATKGSGADLFGLSIVLGLICIGILCGMVGAAKLMGLFGTILGLLGVILFSMIVPLAFAVAYIKLTESPGPIPLSYNECIEFISTMRNASDLDDLNTKVYYALSRWPNYEREITAEYEISKAAICEWNPA